MTKEERDRLVTLRQVKKKLITQKQAAEQLEVGERHVRRMLVWLEERGDKAVVHGLKGQKSNHRMEEEVEQRAIQILSQEVYRGFGPTLASEYLAQRHEITASKETVRKWMLRGKLWRAQREQVEAVHVWRPRRSCLGELVQWDTSEHDWLEGRGERLYLIAMIDDATSRLFARFAPHDSTAENMRTLWKYLERFGRPRLFYTDKAGLFQTAQKRRRDEPGIDQDPVEMAPTQIGRALRELGIGWQGAHSPQAKGRVERNFQTAQDRLVKGMREAGVCTAEQANRYLEEVYLVWWQDTRTVPPARSPDLHQKLEKSHDLAAILSHVETRQVRNDYTIRFEGGLYQIARKDVTPGLRGADVRVEKRLDGEIAVRFREKYLGIQLCDVAFTPPPQEHPRPTRRAAARPHSDWDQNFNLKDGPKIWQAMRAGHPRRGGQE